jgi:hypothetical protein
MNPDLITSLEEHIIALQDADVRNGTAVHEKTIKLLREAKEEILDNNAAAKAVVTCPDCSGDYDTCSHCASEE